MTRTAPLRPTRAAIQLIKRFEDCALEAEPLDDTRWLIGYSHTLSAREGARVSEADAEALLVYDLRRLGDGMAGLIFVDVGRNQTDALLSFAFSIGVEAFAGSDVLECLNGGRVFEAADVLEAWRTGIVRRRRVSLELLARRRAAEKALFLKPDDGWMPAYSARLSPGREAHWPRVVHAFDDSPAEDAGSVVRGAGSATEAASDRVVRRLGALLEAPAAGGGAERGSASSPALRGEASRDADVEIQPFPADPGAAAPVVDASFDDVGAVSAGRDDAFRARVYGDPSARGGLAPPNRASAIGSPSPWAWLAAGSAVFLAGAGAALRLRAEIPGFSPEQALALGLGAIGAAVAAGAAYRLVERTAGRSR